MKDFLVEFSPSLTKGLKLIVPVSMGRYNISEKKTIEYDLELDAILKQTELLLELKLVEQVDVLSTAELQNINWAEELTNKIEHHFFEKHKAVLSKQTNVYTWNDWINRNHIEYNNNYKIVEANSRKETKWFEFMTKTHQTVRMSKDLDKSLEYQRVEYAAIMTMSNYDRLIYNGPISLAWAYMYFCFPNKKLPLFTRVSIAPENTTRSMTNNFDMIETVKMALSNIEHIIFSKNIPEIDKEKFIDAGLSLLLSYRSTTNKKDAVNADFILEDMPSE